MAVEGSFFIIFFSVVRQIKKLSRPSAVPGNAASKTPSNRSDCAATALACYTRRMPRKPTDVSRLYRSARTGYSTTNTSSIPSSSKSVWMKKNSFFLLDMKFHCCFPFRLLKNCGTAVEKLRSTGVSYQLPPSIVEEDNSWTLDFPLEDLKAYTIYGVWLLNALLVSQMPIPQVIFFHEICSMRSTGPK